MWDMRREISVRRCAKAEGSAEERDAGVESGSSAAVACGVDGLVASLDVGAASWSGRLCVAVDLVCSGSVGFSSLGGGGWR